MVRILQPPTATVHTSERTPFYMLWISAVLTAQLPVPTTDKVWLDWIVYLKRWQEDQDFQNRELTWLLDQVENSTGGREPHECPDFELIRKLFNEEFVPELWISVFWLWVHLTNCPSCCLAACRVHPEWAHCDRQGWQEPPAMLVANIPAEAKKRMVELWRQDATRQKDKNCTIVVT